MQDAIILGGGISGLTAAYLLQQQGKEVSLLDRQSVPGGPIQTVRENGYLVERGPNSLLLPDPWVETLIGKLRLGGELVETSPAAKKRYVVKEGRLVSVPTSPIHAISTPLFSWRAKFGFLAEPFRKRIDDDNGSQESVAQFVSRRMGPEFLDYAIDPFVSGVYAGDPSQLILEYAFPIMRQFEREGGSLVRGAFRYKRKRKAEGTAYKKRSVSFRNGLDVLPQALARKLGNRLWLESSVDTIEKVGGGWRATWKRNGEKFHAKAKRLIVCLPSYAIKELEWPRKIASRLQSAPDLHYPAVHSLALGFERSQIKHPLDGFGMLAPSIEKRDILGALFSSSMFEGRAPNNHCLITVMLGGARRPDLAETTEGELVALALNELRALVGLSGEPTFVHLSSWPRAIPQYTSDFGPWSQTLRSLESENDGLSFGGHAIDGIAMGACLMSGKRLAGE